MSGLFAGDGRIDTGGTLQIASFSSRSQEIIAIAGEIRHLRDHGVPYSSITVAYPDVRGQIPLIDEIFADFGIPWNSATGTLVIEVSPGWLFNFDITPGQRTVSS